MMSHRARRKAASKESSGRRSRRVSVSRAAQGTREDSIMGAWKRGRALWRLPLVLIVALHVVHGQPSSNTGSSTNGADVFITVSDAASCEMFSAHCGPISTKADCYSAIRTLGLTNEFVQRIVGEPRNCIASKDGYSAGWNNRPSNVKCDRSNKYACLCRCHRNMTFAPSVPTASPTETILTADHRFERVSGAGNCTAISPSCQTITELKVCHAAVGALLPEDEDGLAHEVSHLDWANGCTVLTSSSNRGFLNKGPTNTCDKTDCLCLCSGSAAPSMAPTNPEPTTDPTMVAPTPAYELLEGHTFARFVPTSTTSCSGAGPKCRAITTISECNAAVVGIYQEDADGLVADCTDLRGHMSCSAANDPFGCFAYGTGARAHHVYFNPNSESDGTCGQPSECELLCICEGAVSPAAPPLTSDHELPDGKRFELVSSGHNCHDGNPDCETIHSKSVCDAAVLALFPSAAQFSLSERNEQAMLGCSVSYGSISPSFRFLEKPRTSDNWWKNKCGDTGQACLCLCAGSATPTLSPTESDLSEDHRFTRATYSSCEEVDPNCATITDADECSAAVAALVHTDHDDEPKLVKYKNSPYGCVAGQPKSGNLRTHHEVGYLNMYENTRACGNDFDCLCICTGSASPSLVPSLSPTLSPIVLLDTDYFELITSGTCATSAQNPNCTSIRSLELCHAAVGELVLGDADGLCDEDAGGGIGSSGSIVKFERGEPRAIFEWKNDEKCFVNAPCLCVCSRTQTLSKSAPTDCVNWRDEQPELNSCDQQLNNGGATCDKNLGFMSCDSRCNLCACATGDANNKEHCSGHGSCSATCTDASAGTGAAQTCTDAVCVCDAGYTGAKCETQVPSSSPTNAPSLATSSNVEFALEWGYEFTELTSDATECNAEDFEHQYSIHGCRSLTLDECELYATKVLDMEFSFVHGEELSEQEGKARQKREESGMFIRRGCQILENEVYFQELSPGWTALNAAHYADEHGETAGCSSPRSSKCVCMCRSVIEDQCDLVPASDALRMTTTTTQPEMCDWLRAATLLVGAIASNEGLVSGLPWKSMKKLFELDSRSACLIPESLQAADKVGPCVEDSVVDGENDYAGIVAPGSSGHLEIGRYLCTVSGYSPSHRWDGARTAAVEASAVETSAELSEYSSALAEALTLSENGGPLKVEGSFGSMVRTLLFGLEGGERSQQYFQMLLMDGDGSTDPFKDEEKLKAAGQVRWRDEYCCHYFPETPPESFHCKNSATRESLHVDGFPLLKVDVKGGYGAAPWPSNESLCANVTIANPPFSCSKLVDFQPGNIAVVQTNRDAKREYLVPLEDYCEMGMYKCYDECSQQVCKADCTVERKLQMAQEAGAVAVIVVKSTSQPSQPQIQSGTYYPIKTSRINITIPAGRVVVPTSISTILNLAESGAHTACLQGKNGFSIVGDTDASPGHTGLSRFVAVRTFQDIVFGLCEDFKPFAAATGVATKICEEAKMNSPCTSPFVRLYCPSSCGLCNATTGGKYDIQIKNDISWRRVVEIKAGVSAVLRGNTSFHTRPVLTATSAFDASWPVQHLWIYPGGEVTLENLEFRDGLAWTGSQLTIKTSMAPFMPYSKRIVIEAHGASASLNATIRPICPGGAVFVEGHVPRISNCVFRNNTGGKTNGGALQIATSGSVRLIERSQFLNNSGFMGGAINVEASSPRALEVIIDSLFSGNTAGDNDDEDSGGGISLNQNEVKLLMIGTVMESNHPNDLSIKSSATVRMHDSDPGNVAGKFTGCGLGHYFDASSFNAASFNAGSVCTMCPPGRFVDEGINQRDHDNMFGECKPCSGGTSSSVWGADSTDVCGFCPPGHRCPEGSSVPERCTNNTVATQEGSAECSPCAKELFLGANAAADECICMATFTNSSNSTEGAYCTCGTDMFLDGKLMMCVPCPEGSGKPYLGLEEALCMNTTGSTHTDISDQIEVGLAFFTEYAVAIVLTFVAVVGGMITIFVRRRRAHSLKITAIEREKTELQETLAAVANENTENKKKLSEQQAAMKRQQAVLDKVVHESALPDLELRYEDIEFGRALGQGAFGVVFQGTYRGKRTVAIKTVKTEKITESVIRDFTKELRIMGPLHHPNLVNLVGASFKDADKLALVLEFCSRGSLKSFMSRSEFTWYDPDDVERSRCGLHALALDISECFVYLHHDLPKPLVHRDMKPDNVLITEDYIAKVADFGESKRFAVNPADEGGDELGETATMVGTPMFCAPEVLTMQHYHTPVDVYSFAVTLLEMLHAGEEKKFIANQYRMVPRIAAAQGWRPEAAANVKSRWPEPLELVHDCWAANPQDRPTFEDIRRRLKAMGTS